MNKLSEMQFRIVICAVKEIKQKDRKRPYVCGSQREKQRHTEREAVK